MLLGVAATINVMAISFTSYAELTLTSADNKSSVLIVAESENLSAGKNNGYYAELNTEGKAVQLYVTYGGVNYEQFASNAATMQDLQLGIVTNASTTYTLTASDVEGTLKIKVNGVEYTIDANGTVFSDLALPANSVLPAAGDEANYVVNPSAPLVQGICFNYNKLQLTMYNGAHVDVFADGAATAAVSADVVGDATYEIDLSNEAAGKYKVVVSGIATPEEYIIDVKPAVTVVP